jgi:hypothetical protein
MASSRHPRRLQKGYTAFDIVDLAPRAGTIAARLVIPPKSRGLQRRLMGFLADPRPVMASQATRPSAEFINSIELRRRVSTTNDLSRRTIKQVFDIAYKRGFDQITCFECEHRFAML